MYQLNYRVDPFMDAYLAYGIGIETKIGCALFL